MRNRAIFAVPRSAALGAVALCAATFAVCLGAADATRTVTLASHITIRSNPNNLTFSGRVSSSNEACDAGRKVTLYRKTAELLGSTTTSSGGRWKITASGSAGISLGRFYAKVARRSEGAAGTIYVCRSARSKTVRFGT